MSSEENAGRQLRRPLRASSSLRTTVTAVKRDSLAAELERDPQFSTAKRQHRTQLFTNSISHASLERQLLQAQTARIDVEAKLREKELAVERLERDRRHFADREREERSAHEQLQAESDAERKRMSAEMSSLRSSLSLLQESHTNLQSSHSQLSLASSQSISHQKALVASLTSRTSHLESSLSSAESLAASRLSEIHELKDELDELREERQKWMHGISEEQDSTVVRGELKRQAEYLQKLESTNSRMSAELVSLRERHQSIEVLREQNRSLEAKVAYTDSLRQKVIELEAELAKPVPAVSPPATPSKTPTVSDTQALSSLRLKHASLLDEHGSTLASLRALQHQHDELQAQLASTESQVESLNDLLKEAKEARRKDDARAKLMEREVKFLKDLVASYQAEEGMAEEGESKPDDAGSRRVAELEALVDEYKSTLASFPPPFTSPSKPTSSPEKLPNITQLRSENESHLARIDELEQQLFDLQGEIAGGRHLPPNTRVLQLADNPEQQWFDLRQQTMDRLKEENEALVKRLKEISASMTTNPPDTKHEDLSDDAKLPVSSTNPDLIPLQSYTSLQSSLSALQSQLAQKEKRLLRLTQVFHSKATEFREAIAAILGVKLAFYPNGQVRVTSVFDLNASFVFQPSTTAMNMKMQLVAQGEGGPQDLPSLMRYWIENEQCPPGFMASVTLECYEKAKRGTEGGVPS